MKTFIIVSEKSWHKKLFLSLSEKFKDYKWILTDIKDDFTYEFLYNIKPKMIFFPHWSYIIPANIYENFECIVFHMTDLPYGRGGSPLQNLIVNGINETKISALKVENGIDTGPIYLKKHLNLYGTAKEIFLRSSEVILEMIEEIILNDLEPKPQFGETVIFKRRKPNDSNMENLNNINKLYDYIRMLDCEDYPHAFIENENFKFEFTRASLLSEKELIADVRIIKK